VIVNLSGHFLASFVVGKTAPPQQPDTQAIAERIKPVGEVAFGQAPRGGISLIATAEAASDDKGKAVYDSSCVACHGSGVAGAPKLGDKPGWKARIAQGPDTLYKHALSGFQGKSGFMPPKGGNASLPDADVKAAVDYMVLKSK
jgi:cytochrome c5